MGTIANKLAKLKTTKAEIKAALEEAGQSVGDVFDTYPAAIRAVVSSGAKIVTGSYVGTGTYGESNPNSLTFDFEPKFVLIFWAEAGNANNGMAYLTDEGGCSYKPAGSNGQWFYVSEITVTVANNVITWYSTSIQSQMNGAAMYRYFAIG